MSKNNFKYMESVLIDYLDGLLTPEEHAKVEFELANSSELQAQLEELKMMFGEMEAVVEYQPSSNLKNNFDELIQQTISEGKEKRKKHNGKVVPLRNRNNLFIQIAAAVALILFGFFMGKRLTPIDNGPTVTPDDLMALRTEMLDMLDKNSTSGRIKAVNIAYQLNEPDDVIVSALVKRLNEDKSTNVRLSAVEALFHFVNDTKVVKALCETLNVQKDPIVQIAIIERLTAFKEKSAIKYFEELIENDDVIDHVKDEAQMGIYKML